MKVRETLNNNADHYAATVFEHDNKVVVIKRDTFNIFDDSTDERFEFSTIAEYETWKAAQEWIVPRKTHTLCHFKNVPMGETAN